MSISERMELHFARRWVARVVLVSGVVGFSWSLVVCIVVDDGLECTPNHDSQGLLFSFQREQGVYI